MHVWFMGKGLFIKRWSPFNFPKIMHCKAWLWMLWSFQSCLARKNNYYIYFAQLLASWWFEIFIPYSIDTKASTILEIVMPYQVLSVIRLPFRVGISPISYLLNFPRVFLPIGVFMNQTCFVTFNSLTLGIRKSGWGKGISSNGGQCKTITIYISMTFVM